MITSPFCYSFGYSEELEGNEKETLKNVFQFKLTEKFLDFIAQNLERVVAEQQLFFASRKDFVDEFKQLLDSAHPHMPYFYKAFKRHSEVRYNFCVPKPEKSQTVSQYLLYEVSFLTLFIAVLNLFIKEYAASDVGKKDLPLPLCRQDIDPYISHQSGKFIGEFYIQIAEHFVSRIDTVLGKYDSNYPEPEKNIQSAINSILLPFFTSSANLTKSTKVDLRQGYLQATIRSNCILFLVCEAGCKLVARGALRPMELLALFAGAGKLLAMSE